MTKNHLLWISCALAIIGLLMLPAAAATQEKSAFSRGAWEDIPGVRIHVINPDGTGLSLLDPDPLMGDHYEEDPAWAPDGSMLAYATDVAGVDRWDIVVTGFGGHPARGFAIPSRPYDAWPFSGSTDPAWSPDGSRLAFASDLAMWEVEPWTQNRDIYVAALDGTAPVRRNTDPATDTEPIWSPDGSRMVFARDGELYLMNADGTGQVPQGAGRGYDPAWGVVTVTPAAAIADLAARVEGLDLRPGIEAGLTDKLDAAVAGLSAGNEKTAVNNLNAFVRMVRAQGGRAISAADAAALTAGAKSITEDLRP